MPKMDVTPSKHIFEALIQDIDANRAISDLLDNAIDNWKIQKQSGELRIDISINQEQIEIKDYSGGIDLESLPLLLMPGGTRGGGSGIRGIWGVGSKRAIFSLGKNTTIKTRRHGGAGLVLRVDEEWFSKDQGEDRWEIEYEQDSSIEEGVTTITITGIKVLIDPYTVASIKKYITKTYRDELMDRTLEIFFNGEKVNIMPDIPWAKSEFTPPSRYITDIPVLGNGRKLHFEISAGVMIQPGEDYSYGIDFIGNKRVILQNNLDGRMGFDKDRLGFPHPTINRFKAVVRVSGDSRDIPWNSAKSDVNTNHAMYVGIVDLVVQVSRQYVSFLRKNYEVTSRLFKERAEESDIKDVPFEYGKQFQKVVKDYQEERKEKRISFTVPEEEYNELVEYFRLERSTGKQVGLFIFERTLKEIRGLV
jgi:hypothetical protein